MVSVASSLFYLIMVVLSRYVIADDRVPFGATVHTIIRQALVGIKVSILLAIELCLFPILIGCCIDVLTLDLMQATFESRKAMLSRSPVLFVLLHWLVGFVFMLNISYYASLLRKVIKRKVLSKIIRYPDDPDFHPFRELVHVAVLTHLRRMGVTFLLYCMLV